MSSAIRVMEGAQARFGSQARKPQRTASSFVAGGPARRMVAREVAFARDYVGAVLALGCVLLALRTAPARAESLTGIVRISTPADERLLERVRGQVSDLEVRLTPVAAPPLEATLAEQLALARKLAGEHGASVALWFVHVAPRVEVVVVDLRLDRVLVRALEAGDGPLARSALEESAALVVRSALKAVLVGDALGSPEREVVPAAPVPRLQLPVAPAPPKASARFPPSAEQRTAPGEQRWLLAIGAQGALDGASARGHYGLFAGLTWARRRLELGLRGSVGLPAAVATELAELAFAEHASGGYVGYVPVAGPRLRLTCAVGASLRVLTTRVRSNQERFVGEHARAFTGALDAEARVTYLPAWTKGAAGLALGASLVARTTPIVLGYEAPTGFVRVARMRALQPLVTLGLVLRL